MRKFIAISIMLLSILCVSPSTFAGADWVEIGRDNDNIHSISRTSIKEKNGKIYAWVKTIFRNDRIKQQVYNKSLAYGLSHFVFNLNDDTFGFRELIYYDASGSIIHYLPHISPDYSAIIPSSDAEYIFNYCKRYLHIE